MVTADSQAACNSVTQQGGLEIQKCGRALILRMTLRRSWYHGKKGWHTNNGASGSSSGGGSGSGSVRSSSRSGGGGSSRCGGGSSSGRGAARQNFAKSFLRCFFTQNTEAEEVSRGGGRQCHGLWPVEVSRSIIEDSPTCAEPSLLGPQTSSHAPSHRRALSKPRRRIGDDVCKRRVMRARVCGVC